MGQLEKQGTGNGTGTGKGTGTGNENLREAAGTESETTVALGYGLHESQGRVGLRTHGCLTLFMSRTRKKCGGGYNNQLDHRQSEIPI